jgi:hypothetical protein
MPGPGIGIADIGSVSGGVFPLQERLIVAEGIFDKTFHAAAVFGKTARFTIVTDPEE